MILDPLGKSVNGRLKMSDIKVIDSLVTLPITGGPWELQTNKLPDMKRYAELYATWKDSEPFLNDSPQFKGRDFREALQNISDGPFDNFIKVLDDIGIERIVCRGHDSRSTGGRYIPNQTIAELARKFPERLIAFSGVDPLQEEVAVRDLEHAVKELGLKGLYVAPWELNIYSNDKRLYPLFAKCVELGVPLYIHCSINFGVGRRMDLTHPIYLDAVANDFPDLKIIANHAGWPWVLDLVAAAWRNPNLYIGIADMRPKYIGMHNTGWEPLVLYGNSILQDKILFATGWPALPFKRSIEEVLALPLKDSVKEKWLYLNAARLFELE